MKKIVLIAVLLGLLSVFGVSRADQNIRRAADEEKHFVLTSFLYSSGTSVSFELAADILDAQNPKNVFLSASLVKSSGFGFAEESTYFNRLQLPDGALQMLDGGKKIILDADLTLIQNFTAFQRFNGGLLNEISDPSAFSVPEIRFVWQLGDVVPAYGGTIQALYRRPDGEWSRSVVSSIKRETEGSGNVLGMPDSAFSLRRFEYTEDTKEQAVSSLGIDFLSLVFPLPPGFPQEP